MQYLSAAASLRLKYVCDRDSEMQNLEICMSGKCKKRFFLEVLPLFSFDTARLMWQKWFLVVGFPKHEPIFFFKLFPTFSVRIAYKNPRANKFR